ncbi:MAG TPA: hypothetical protein VL856_19240, partial [Acidimicrobiia bacterium]|nr:hypothetical protein [Acidimicrobiia bacterium]
MRNVHMWNLLSLHVPNLLPQTVFGSHFPRKGGRLIWATLMFTAGCIIAFVLVRRPKKTNEPATWAQTMLGAMAVWVMFTLGYGVIPSEWIIFGNSYLNFDSSTYMLKRDQFASHLPPFDITRDKLVDAVAALIYVVVLVLNVYFFAAWQKRKVAEPAVESEEGEAPAPSGGPFARFRREKRTSAYGR